jgi:Zn-dependent M28 family amino/carboxypeptidase
MRSVRHLANEIGPRPGTSPAFAAASDWVQQQFEKHGYDVRRQSFRVPAGNSWGIDVPAGQSNNVIATAPGFDATRQYLIVGAHLDTVPQAPGAEDNASGVSVALELARMAAIEVPQLQVMFVAFGSEEPRGSGDDLHHFGSRAMVERLTSKQRRGLVSMVSLDRVGVGAEVPVSTGGLEPPTIRNQLLRAADRVGVAAFADDDNQTSDHWSFDKAGLPSARIGSTPYAGYHSAADVPAVVNPAQLERVGTLMWTWLRGPVASE